MEDEIEGEISKLVRELAKKYGFRTDKALDIIADLTITFIRSILSSKEKLSSLSDLLGEEDEWKYVAFSVKRTPVCSSPCPISLDLESVVREYGFGNLHYFLLLKHMCGGSY